MTTESRLITLIGQLQFTNVVLSQSLEDVNAKIDMLQSELNTKKMSRSTEPQEDSDE